MTQRQIHIAPYLGQPLMQSDPSKMFYRIYEHDRGIKAGKEFVIHSNADPKLPFTANDLQSMFNEIQFESKEADDFLTEAGEDPDTVFILGGEGGVPLDGALVRSVFGVEYHCDDCDEHFSDPKTIMEDDAVGHGVHEVEVCPHCQSQSIEKGS